MKIIAPKKFKLSYFGVPFIDGIAEVEYLDEITKDWFIRHGFIIEENNDTVRLKGKRKDNAGGKSEFSDRSDDRHHVYGDGSTSEI